MIPVTDHIAIDEDELEEVFVRASGPGGQNVNKVATGVQLRFDAFQSPSLDEAAKARILAALGRSGNNLNQLLQRVNAYDFRGIPDAGS